MVNNLVGYAVTTGQVLIKSDGSPWRPLVHVEDICRAFLATLVAKGNTTSLQGTACRPSGGEWAIKDVKPWRKPA